MKTLRSLWKNRGIIGLWVSFVVLLVIFVFVMFQQQIYGMLHKPNADIPVFVTQNVTQGQSWTVLRADKNNYTCVWKNGQSVPECLNLVPVQYSGSAGFAFVRDSNRKTVVFLFLFGTGSSPPKGLLVAQDTETGFQIDSQ